MSYRSDLKQRQELHSLQHWRSFAFLYDHPVSREACNEAFLAFISQGIKFTLFSSVFLHISSLMWVLAAFNFGTDIIQICRSLKHMKFNNDCSGFPTIVMFHFSVRRFLIRITFSGRVVWLLLWHDSTGFLHDFHFQLHWHFWCTSYSCGADLPVVVLSLQRLLFIQLYTTHSAAPHIVGLPYSSF